MAKTSIEGLTHDSQKHEVEMQRDIKKDTKVAATATLNKTYYIPASLDPSPAVWEKLQPKLQQLSPD